jgi:hypothetical protein
VSDIGSTVGPATERKPASKGCLIAMVLFLALFFCGVCLGPISPAVHHPKDNIAMQQGRQIGQAMFSYATDNVQNGNAYPDGNSSTEVFQKLIDGGYVTDPTIFYVPLPGKVKAVAGQKLKPENVCWDVTSGVDSNSSDLVPLVFITGYRMTYAPGGSAVPVIKPYPPFWSEPRTWSQWWNDAPAPEPGPSGIAIFYKGNNAVFLKLNLDGSLPNVVSPEFKPDGKTYRQLTPDGPLPGN